jgi:hypothetical protein
LFPFGVDDWQIVIDGKLAHIGIMPDFVGGLKYGSCDAIEHSQAKEGHYDQEEEASRMHYGSVGGKTSRFSIY